jgi:beta-N-acetylhexosaminidase
MTLVWSVIRLTLGAGLVALAYDWRTPTFANIREWILIGLIIAPLCLAAVEFSILRRPVSRSMKRACTIASLALAALALGWTLALQADFLWIRRAVLTADTGLIEQLGRHIIVGYRNGAELKNLIDRRAIAGVYITSRNIKDRSADDIRRDIAAWQATRQRQGLPPLWITADQEGGLVSRLSPPLRRRMSLSQFAADSDRAAREAATKTYAANQAQELRDLGVNLNLAPVVDVNHGDLR